MLNKCNQQQIEEVELMNNKIAIIGEACVGKSIISAEFCKLKNVVIDKFYRSWGRLF